MPKFQSVTAVPYRRCDSRNMGVSKLCSLNDPTLPFPQIFGSSIKESSNGLLLTILFNSA